MRRRLHVRRKAGLAPRFLCFILKLLLQGLDLPPVAFNQDPAIVVVNPLVRDPDAAGMGRTVPAAGNPDVAVAVPVVITGDPHVAAIRWRRAALNDGSRRANTNHNLRKRSCRRQTKCKQHCQCDFLHGELCPPWVYEFPEYRVHSGLLKISTCYGGKCCALAENRAGPLVPRNIFNVCSILLRHYCWIEHLDSCASIGTGTRVPATARMDEHSVAEPFSMLAVSAN